jgi:alginate O-acetyltransferase complex protein AlgI
VLFTSLHFFIFFAVVLIGLRLLRNNEHKITWLMLAGAVFYGYWNWKFLALLGFTSVFDFYLGLRIGAADGVLKKRLLALDIIVNLGILCVFKYLNFFIDSANAVLPAGLHFPLLHIMLPIGISFFVFEAMSYCIDIYRGKLEPYRNWRHFAVFIFFFPRLIAGPIIRPADFLPQLQREIRITQPNLIIGGQMFLMGMTKKLVIADRLSGFVDLVFGHPGQYSGVSIWQATIAYSIQIFCDFSGYSDMALGLAKILGFDLPINFRMPYIATSLTDFWRRWHISLSSWLRDYLYIPLGGNRRGVGRTYLHLLITMTLGGLWHGASWNFVIWGVLHGLGLAVHKAFATVRSRWHWKGDDIVTRVVSWAVTYLFVCLCWVFFRAQSFGDAMTCLLKMADVLQDGLTWICGPLLIILPVVILAHAIGLLLQSRKTPLILNLNRFSHLVFLFCWMMGIFFLSATVSAPFIYFQF